MDMIQILNGAPEAAGFLGLALLMPLVGAAAVWAISLYGQTIPGNAWRDRRDAIIWSSCGITLLAVLALGAHLGAEVALPCLGGMGMSLGVDGLRYLLAVLAAVLWLLASVFSRDYLAHSGHKMRYYFFFLLGESGILCALLSADLYTMLTGLVILNIASWVLAGHLETEAAHAAAGRALVNLVLGGMLALMGLFLLGDMFGTLRFAALRVLGAACKDRLTLYTAGLFLLMGFSVICTAWPGPRRLPTTAYAPGPAAALLSGAVTVAWLFSAMVLGGLLFWWDRKWGLVLCCLGLILMLAGAVSAVCKRDLKQILALLSMSQTGMILLALGFNCLLTSKNEVAAAAVVLHSVHHGVCQLVLFLCAGAVGMHLPQLDLDSIRGFGRGKPALVAAFLLGGLSLCGMPLLAGSVSLTLLFDAAALCAQRCGSIFILVQGALLVACVLSFAAVLRLVVCLCFEKNASDTLQARYEALSARGLSVMMQALLVGSGVLLAVLGLTARLSLNGLADACVGFFSASLNAPITAFRLESLLLGVGIAVPGTVLWWLLRRRR